VFIARYGLSPYIKQTRLVFKRINFGSLAAFRDGNRVTEIIYLTTFSIFKCDR
jgi:hypothetical protein